MTKLASALPKDHGLTSRLLANNPEATHLIIGIADVKQLTTDVDTGDIEPTVRVLNVEIVNTADGPDAQAMLKRALEKRTGKSVLEGFDMSGFDGIEINGVDVTTGEVVTS